MQPATHVYAALQKKKHKNKTGLIRSSEAQSKQHLPIMPTSTDSHSVYKHSQQCKTSTQTRSSLTANITTTAAEINS